MFCNEFARFSYLLSVYLCMALIGLLCVGMLSDYQEGNVYHCVSVMCNGGHDVQQRLLHSVVEEVWLTAVAVI